MKWRGWRASDDAQLRKLHARHLSQDEIAREIGCSDTTIRDRARRLGLEWEARPGGRSSSWGDDRDALLKELIVAGKSAAAAGAVLGTSNSACIARARRLGLRFTGQPFGKKDGPRADAEPRSNSRQKKSPSPGLSRRPMNAGRAMDGPDKPGHDGKGSVAAAAFAPGIPRPSAAPRLRVHPSEPAPKGPPGEFIAGCKWLHGEVIAHYRQCGAALAAGSRSWCEHHIARVGAGKPPVNTFVHGAKAA